ncbi:MAG: ROK family protein [Limisphaerales bacterium]
MRKIDLNDFRLATSETARDINSRIVLNLVRKHQPVSRADLMRFSGLQRSTVSAIAERLIADRWLREGARGNLPRGRRPTYLHLNAERCAVIGVDVQPGTTAMAVANMEARFLVQEFMPTPKDPADFILRLCRRIKDLLRAHPKHSYEGIGISLPGRIDASADRLIYAPNLGWGDLNLKTPIEKAIGLPVKLENAANACALAELWSGQHSESVRNLLTVTVSDGIGVGMIMNGQLIRGSSGMAGEFGHVVLMPDGPLCRCGRNGCWETLASNSAAVRYYAEAVSVPNGGLASKSDNVPVRFTDILRLVEQDDPKACQALNQMAHYLGTGLAMLATGLAPDVMVVVGEVTRVWEKIEPVVTAAVQRALFAPSSIRIFAGNSDLQPRLRGIIALVLQEHFVAPSIA